MVVRTIIAALLSIYAMLLVMRHNLHMFQLNEYNYDEHFNWIRRNLRQQWLLGFGAVVGVIRIAFPFWGVDIIVYLTLLLEILVYRAMRRLNTKKKLVYTSRVKRMIVTILLGAILILFLIYMWVGVKPLTGVLLLIVSAQWISNVLANIINHPIETIIKKYYINDAKKKLKGRPDLLIVGITGSYGKTSMKFYLQTLLQGKYNVLVTPGNFNTPLGVTRTIRDYLNPTHEVFLCEMGASRVGDIKAICDIVHPDHGVITSVGPQHLETFFSMENIKKTKFELADELPNNGYLFLNGDNEYIQEKAKGYNNKIFYYSENQGDGYYAKDVVLSQLGTEFTVVAPNGESERFRIKLIGAHNVINVCGAIAVANTLGVPLKDLRIPVRRIQPVEHRMQMRENGPVTIIDDSYNSNPVGSKAAVNTLAMFDGVKILVTPGMVELGDQEEMYNYKFGTYAAECCDYILLVGKKHTEPIYRGAIDKGFSKDNCLAFNKIEEAMTYAQAIKGQGHKYILIENDLPDNY